MCEQFIAVGAFGAEPPARDRRFRIAFNRNEFAVFVEDQLPASYAAVGTNRTRHLSSSGSRSKQMRSLRHCFAASAVASILDLFDKGPAREKVKRHFGTSGPQQSLLYLQIVRLNRESEGCAFVRSVILRH